MKLVFERGLEGQFQQIMPACDVPVYEGSAAFKREGKLNLPHLSENELSVINGREIFAERI